MLLKVEVATLAHLWKLFVQVAVLDFSADAKVRTGFVESNHVFKRQEHYIGNQ
jgi:hypothetical protein